MKPKRIVIIVAGGSGVRMGGTFPKQFLELRKKPILFHTIEVFQTMPSIAEIILVLPKPQILLWKNLCKEYGGDINYKIVGGGETRFQSVYNGLNMVSDLDALVAIHDGVRPLVSKLVVENCFNAAEIYGAVVPAIRPLESVRYTEKGKTTQLERDNVLLIQTPQVFKSSILKNSYETIWQPSFTDDASVVEYAGHSIHIIDGNRENVKITTPQDLWFAETILNNQIDE